MDFNQQVGANIRRIRKLWHITQGALAERVNRSRPSIVNIEKGTQGISVELLADIAMALGVSPTELIQNEKEEQPMKKESNPPMPEGVDKPDPPTGPPPRKGVFHLGPGEMLPAPPPLFNNPIAQRAYDAMMADAQRREEELKSSSLNQNDVHQFMLDAHAMAIRTAFDIVIEGIKATQGE